MDFLRLCFAFLISIFINECRCDAIQPIVAKPNFGDLPITEAKFAKRFMIDDDCVMDNNPPKERSIQQQSHYSLFEFERAIKKA
jgi:hypothetical protein